MISKKHLITTLSIVGLLGVSSYSCAVANTLLYRSPVNGAKVDEQSEVQKQKNRIEEEKQEQENINMCLSQEYIPEEKTELFRLDLNQPHYIAPNGRGDISKISINYDNIPFDRRYVELVRNGNVLATGDRYGNSIFARESSRYSYWYGRNRVSTYSESKVFSGSVETGDTILLNSQRVVKIHDLINHEDYNGISEYDVNNDQLRKISFDVSSYDPSETNFVIGYDRTARESKTENYDWCVENGYETAN